MKPMMGRASGKNNVKDICDERRRSVYQDFALVTVMAWLLMLSGAFHLLWLLVTQSEWEGPLSLRKPALFGLSGGLTLWSIAWVLTKLPPHRFDRPFAMSMGVGLLLEVGLITVQQWRGVASHFNHATAVDAAIEATMLLLITFVSLGITWLAVRSLWLTSTDAATRVAIQGGLWLLVVSCLLGFAITFAGEWNASTGKSPELWGRAGVMKYPHGAALHAIQLLPLLAYCSTWLPVNSRATLLRATLASQFLLLGSAIWQTVLGRSRFDLDIVGGSLLLGSVLLMVYVAFEIAAGLSRMKRI